MARFLIVALEGDLCDRLAEIISICGKTPKDEIQFFADWSSVASQVRQEGCLVAGCSGNWTVLCEGSITEAIFNDERLGTLLAERYSTRVVSAFGDDTGCVYGYRVYSPANIRAVWVSGDTIEENLGDPIPGEPPVIAEEYNEYCVLEVLEMLGIDIIEGLESCKKSALQRFE